jgi:hypothetical protein
LVVGPYVLHESEDAEVKDFEIPLRLYSRKSLSKFVNEQKEEFFKASMNGLKFYQEFFKTPWPFNKLD